MAGMIAMALLPALAGAQEQVAPQPSTTQVEPAITDLAPMMVSGIQPGPGLWKVSRDGHVLWVLGTLAPLPKKMEWRSQDVEQAIAQSQELLLPPTLSLDTGRGMFRSLFLIPALLKARKNPDGKTLQDVVPADQYARWSVLKARYIGSDKGIEQWRPIFAATELYMAAMKRSGLTMGNPVRGQVEKLAKRGNLTITDATSTARLDDPKAAIKEFQRTGLEDQTCFVRTLEVIDREIDTMRDQANAWAVGDVDALRNSPQTSQYAACQTAISESAIARKFGVGNLRQQSLQLWLQKAETALSRNASTVGLLPIGLVLGRDNLMDQLKARGYTVEAPGEY
ncbi:TraB/GumN family protein [Pseudoxanthomonas sp.]|uniref:TraB/GumN family protein n=1 Tax=Pseudoxanthomonas sp. TaxID=1871049 RepID=UPI002618D7FE|nr:TraB/GumN family protein [Pseudoxanthomonas sp.]WDS36310.1 MAG: TraB/GumN family protein [Pseudoxanthomonas sp.]